MNLTVCKFEARRAGMTHIGSLYGIPVYTRYRLVHDFEGYDIIGKYIGTLLVLQIMVFFHCLFTWAFVSDPVFTLPVKEYEVIK